MVENCWEKRPDTWTDWDSEVSKAAAADRVTIEFEILVIEGLSGSRSLFECV